MKKLIEKMYGNTKEMSADIQSRNYLPCWEKYRATEQRDEDDWAGASMDEAYELLTFGDVKGASMIHEAGEVSVPRQDSAPVARLSVRGCLPSVPNYLRGVPNNMLDIRREPNRKPVMSVYINVCVGGSIDRRDMAKAARLIAGVIKRIEQKGVRVNLYSGMINIKEEAAYSCFVKVKDSGAPLNLVNCAFPLTHPAFFRRTLFAWIERYATKFDRGYGRVRTFADLERETGRKYEGVKFDLQRVILEKWTEDRISKEFNDYLKEGK